MNNMVEEVKSIISDFKYGHWEEDILAVTDYGYAVKFVDEVLIDNSRWENVSEHICKIEKDGVLFYIAVEVSLGLTEMQESAGITNIYQVYPKEVKCTKWVTGGELNE